MLSFAFAIAPVAAASLFAASLPMLAGIRQRHLREVARPRLASDALELSAAEVESGSMLAVAARNRTDRVHTLALSLSVYSDEGTEVARVELPPRRVLPGRSVEEQVDLGALDLGRYQAVIVAEFGGGLFAARHAWSCTAAPAARIAIAA